jgi:tetratricopeptide (TPR) repeat protein
MHPAPLNVDAAGRELLQQSLQALELARRSGQAWAMAEAQLGLARWYRERGELGFSLSLLEAALAAAPGLDQRVEMHCETVNVLAQLSTALESLGAGRGRATRDSARQHIFKASMLAAHLADTAWEAKVLLHLSDILDGFGDRGDAVHLQNRALQLMGRSIDGFAQAFNPHLVPGLGRLADG